MEVGVNVCPRAQAAGSPAMIALRSIRQRDVFTASVFTPDLFEHFEESLLLVCAARKYSILPLENFETLAL